MMIGPVSAYQKVYLFSITDYSPDIWSNPNQVRLGAFKTTPTYDAYVWDLQSLAAYIGDPEDGDNSGRIDFGPVPYLTVSKDSGFWHQIWVQEIKDDAGSKAISRMPTLFAVSSFNKIEAEKYVYEGSFNFSPLVMTETYYEDVQTESLNGEIVLYNAALFPGYPILVGSSLPEHQHFGPVFLKSASFRCMGTGGLNAVEVNVNFGGARTLRSPVLEVAPTEYTALGGDPKVYRAASIIDCLVGYNVWTDIATMREDLWLDVLTEYRQPELRVVGLELNINQSVEYKTPEPLNNFQEQHGPRFVSISNRTVNGSITYFSRTNSMEQIETDALTMYFGGPFLFPMTNVEWQKPSTAIRAGDGWLRTYSFIARSAESATTLPFQDGSGGYPASEFAIPSLPDDGSNDEEDEIEFEEDDITGTETQQ